MSKKSLLTLIQGLGLTDHEATAYLTSLSLGPTTALDISRKSGMHRTTVYAVIETLKKKGFMHEEVRGFKKRFVVESPEKLEAGLEQKRSQLQNALPELMSLYNVRGGEGTLRFYEGLQEIKNAYELVLSELGPHDRYCAISDTERWYDLDPSYFNALVERRTKQRLKVQLILQESARAREFKKFENNFNFKVKIIPEGKNFTMSFLVTSRHILLHALTEPTSAILIENPRAIEMQQQVFDLMWDSLPGSSDEQDA